VIRLLFLRLFNRRLQVSSCESHSLDLIKQVVDHVNELLIKQP